ncbi:putative oxidoreductase [Paracoccus marcusii]|uniref:SDR family oxidoreductase n=1 Tax=Paracoccus marcusii TaxID=59779 RepID=UPI001C3E7A3B|nr:SDR family oxidoreductase [Paracoccus marcusii]QXI63485.1 putative oxidoreductase [Paracoccus marcusii]
MSYLERMRPTPGLRVLVTAGASGLGAAIAGAFCEAGAQVVICDLDQRALDLFAAAHPDVDVRCADVSDSADVDRLFAGLDGLDVLINNAGIAGPTGPIDTLQIDDIRRTLDVGVMGQFLTIRHAAPLLRASGAGAIINVSSVAGRLGYAMRTPYAAAKWGIVGLTASLAKEMGPDGIRVNAILPGPVRGPRMEGVIRDRAAAQGVTFEAMEAEYLSNISLRRMVGPEDVASLALFLCSAAGGNISGQAISVCGNVETL